MGHLYSLSDDDLLKLLRENDAQAFSCLYERYWKKVLAVAVHKVGDVVEAENMVQDIFYALWARRKVLVVNGSLNNYLMVSVKYQVIKWLDRQRRLRDYTGQIIPMDLLDDSTRAYLEFVELNKKLQQLIEELPAQPKLIYKLNSEEGKSYKEIATQMGITEKSVDSHLARTKKMLRTKLRRFLTIYLLA